MSRRVKSIRIMGAFSNIKSSVFRMSRKNAGPALVRSPDCRPVGL